jgi:hypothetical protein
MKALVMFDVILLTSGQRAIEWRKVGEKWRGMGVAKKRDKEG